MKVVPDTLRSLTLKDFTLFHKADLKFGRDLNVVIGENGTGKSHILKAAYSGIAAALWTVSGSPLTKTQLQKELAAKLIGVFRPDALGRLVRRARGRLKCELIYAFERPELNIRYSFSRLAKTEVVALRAPTGRIEQRPIFLPTRELLTLLPEFVPLYDSRYLPFEVTWRGTCSLLGEPLARGPREDAIKTLLEPLEEAMQGSIEQDNAGRFYLRTKSSGKLEMHLVAEGLRKLAMIARLIATGALLDSGYLFWDEPEANLNPKMIKVVARTILQISQSGIQVFVATHSLFLLRELHILRQQAEFKKIDGRCFGLHVQEDGSVAVEQGPTMDEVGSIAALDEELTQTDRYMESVVV